MKCQGIKSGNKGRSRDKAICPGYAPYSENTAAHNGFTLVELLVVISIIGLLMGLLLPAMNKARAQAHRITCMSNMRQIGIALQGYTSDNRDRLPPSSCHTSDPNEYWLRLLTRYMRETLVFRCAADKSKSFIDWNRPIDEQPENARWSSFALNALLDPLCTRYQGRYNFITAIRKPHYCIFVAESPSSWTKYDHIHPEQWFYNIQLAKGQVAWDRHLVKSNYLFVDGHCGNLKIEQTYSWPGECYWFPESAPQWPPDE